jgi:pyruvate dehydrogenase E2 component (dihydrolipoamide acetyltransferase)
MEMEGSNDKIFFDLQRRVVSHMTSSSWRTVPHVSFVYEPDVTEFIHTFKKPDEDKLTLNTVVLKIIAEGLKRAPTLNAFVDYNQNKGEGSVIIKKEINIAMPWLLADGRMITPTILDCGNKSLRQITDDIANIKRKIANTDVNELLFSAIRNDTIKEMKKLNFNILKRIIAAKITRHPVKGMRGKEKENYYSIGKEDRLTKEDLLSATISVSNIGSLYKDLKGYFGMLQIIPPQIFALGINALQERPGVYIDSNNVKAIGVRKYLPLTIVFDHRAVDFYALIPFIKECDQIFNNPERLNEW